MQSFCLATLYEYLVEFMYAYMWACFEQEVGTLQVRDEVLTKRLARLRFIRPEHLDIP